MCKMISVLVSKSARVFAVDGVHSHSEIAKQLGLDEDQHLKYEFHLKERKLFQDFTMDDAPFEAKASHDAAAQAFFDECAGTPERLVEYVKRGNWDDVLVELLIPIARAEYKKVRASALVKCEKVYASAWAEYDKACASALAKYKKVYASALAKCEKVCAPALVEYNKACAPAWAEYEKVYASAWAECEKACASARAEYDKVCAPALVEYNKACAPAWAEYEKVYASAWAEYDNVRDSAQAEYEKACASAWAELFLKEENRIGVWK